MFSIGDKIFVDIMYGIFDVFTLIKLCEVSINSINLLFTEGLLLRIWFSLIAHMKNGLDSGTRGEMKDTVTTFLTQFQILVLSQTLTPKIILVGRNNSRAMGSMYSKVRKL